MSGLFDSGYYRALRAGDPIKYENPTDMERLVKAIESDDFSLDGVYQMFPSTKSEANQLETARAIAARYNVDEDLAMEFATSGLQAGTVEDKTHRANYAEAMGITAKSWYHNTLGGLAYGLHYMFGNDTFMKAADNHYSKVQTVWEDYGALGNIGLGIENLGLTAAALGVSAAGVKLTGGALLSAIGAGTGSAIAGAIASAMPTITNVSLAGLSSQGAHFYKLSQYKDKDGNTLDLSTPEAKFHFYFGVITSGAMTVAAMKALAANPAMQMVRGPEYYQTVLEPVALTMLRKAPGTALSSGVSMGLRSFVGSYRNDWTENALKAVANKQGASFDTKAASQMLGDAFDDAISIAIPAALMGAVTGSVRQAQQALYAKATYQAKFDAAGEEFPFVVDMGGMFRAATFTPREGWSPDTGTPPPPGWTPPPGATMPGAGPYKPKGEGPAGGSGAVDRPAPPSHHEEPVKVVIDNVRFRPINAAEQAKVDAAEAAGETDINVIIADKVVSPEVAQNLAEATGASIDDSGTLVFSDDVDLELAVLMARQVSVSETETDDSITFTLNDRDGGVTDVTLSKDVQPSDDMQETEADEPISAEAVKSVEDIDDNERSAIASAIGDIVAHTGGWITQEDLEDTVTLIQEIGGIVGMPSTDLLDKHLSFELAKDIEGDGGAPALGKFEKVGDGQYKITVSSQANPTTLVHESAHFLRAMLSDDQLVEFNAAYGSLDGGVWIDDITEKDGTFFLGGKQYATRDAALAQARHNEEMFADDFIEYLSTDHTSKSILREFFEKMKRLLRGIIDAFRNKLSDEVKEAFDNLFEKKGSEVVTYNEGSSKTIPSVALMMMPDGSPAITVGYPVKPSFPTAEEAKAIGGFRNVIGPNGSYRKSLYAWRDNVKDWAEGQGDMLQFMNPATPNFVMVIHKNTIPDELPWRGTSFMKRDGEWIPMGHADFETKYEAIINRVGPGSEHRPDVLFQGLARTDTPEFKTWFGDSKVVDKNGEPKIMYHGSPSQFDAFGVQRTSYGYFFTPDPDTAKYYGKILYEVYLASSNPVDLDNSKALISVLKSAYSEPYSPTSLGYYLSSAYGQYDSIAQLDDMMWDLETDSDRESAINDAIASIDDGYMKDRAKEDVFLIRDGLGSTGVYAYRSYGTQEFYMNYQNDVLGAAEEMGHDGVMMTDPSSTGRSESFVVFRPSQVKSIYNTGSWKPEKESILYQSYDWDKGWGNGYDHSKNMSVNAVDAYDRGVMPKHKWTKVALGSVWLDLVGSELPDMPIADLKTALLRYSEWHHTGKNFTKTDFYEFSVDAARALAHGSRGHVRELEAAASKAYNDYTPFVISVMHKNDLSSLYDARNLISEELAQQVAMNPNDTLHMVSGRYIDEGTIQKIKDVHYDDLGYYNFGRGTDTSWMDSPAIANNTSLQDQISYYIDKKPGLTIHDLYYESYQELDRRYFLALEKDDNETARKIVDTVARKRGYVSDDAYRMMHKAPNGRNDFDENIAQLTDSKILPKDYWDRPEWYISSEERHSFNQVMDAIRLYKKYGKANIRMYRAVPKDLEEIKFRNGDWITPSREYAITHGMGIPGGYRIIRNAVPVEHAWWDANSIEEFGYDDGEEYYYRDTANNRKLSAVVALDRNGDVIPPSKRFNYKEYTLYQLRHEKVQEIIEEKEKDIEDAIAKGYWVPMEVVEQYRHLPWAQDEIRFQRQIAKFPEALEIAQEYPTIDEFVEAIKEQPSDDDKQGLEWLAEDESWARKAFYHARIEDQGTMDKLFAVNHNSDAAIIRLAERLRVYGDVEEGREISRFGVFSGVDRKVLRINRSSSAADIAEAREIVQQKPRAYRRASLAVGASYGRVSVARGGVDDPRTAHELYLSELGEGLAAILKEPIDFSGVRTREVADISRDTEIPKVRIDARARLATKSGVLNLEHRMNAELKALGIESDRKTKKLERALANAKAEHDKVWTELKEKRAELGKTQTRLEKSWESKWKLVEHLDRREKIWQRRIDALNERIERMRERDRARRLKQEINRLQKSIIDRTAFNPNTIDAMYEEPFAVIVRLSDASTAFPYPVPDHMAKFFSSEMLGWIQDGRPFDEWTLGDLQQLSEGLNVMRRDGKQRLESKKVRRMDRLADVISGYYMQQYGEAATITDPDRSVIFNVQDDFARTRPGYKESTIDAYRRTVEASIIKIQWLSRMADGNRDGVVFEWLVRRGHENSQQSAGNTNRRLSDADAKMKDLGIAYGDLWKVRHTFTNSRGEEVELTLEQVIGMYIYGQSPLGLDKIVHPWGNNIPQDEMDRAIAKLKQNEKDWGDYAISAIDEWDRLQEAFYTIYNQNLGRRPRYFPLRGNGVKDYGNTDILNGPMGNSIRYTDKGFTKAVNPSAVYPLELRFMGTFKQNIARQEHFMAWAEWVRDTNYMMTRGGLGKMIQAQVGPKHYNAMIDWVKRVGSPQNILTDLDRLGNLMLGNITVAKLSLNFLTVLKQLPSVSTALAHPDVDLGEFAVASFRMLNPSAYKEMEEFIHRSSPMMESRQVDIELQRFYETEFDTKASRMMQRFHRDFGMKGISLADKMVVNPLWMATYNTYMKRNPSGLKGEALHKEAVFRADQIISTTQPSSSEMDRSMIQGSKTPFVRAAIMFTNQLMQYTNAVWFGAPSYIQEWRTRSKEGDTQEAKDARKRAVGLVMSMVLSGALMMIASGKIRKKSGESDEAYAKRMAKEAAATALTYSVPVVGDVTGQALTGQFYDSSIFELPAKIGDLVASAGSGEEKFVKALKNALSATGDMMGVPTTFTRRLQRAISEENPLELFGRDWAGMWEDMMW